MKNICKNLSLAAVLVAAVGCNEKKPAFEGPPEDIGERCSLEGTDRFLPLASGTEWAYVNTKLSDGTTTEKMQFVGDPEDIGGMKAGIMGFPLTTIKEDGENVTWQEDTGTSILRHKEQDRAGNTHRDEIFDEFKVRIDESEDRTMEGATYSVSFVETSTRIDTLETKSSERSEDWTVEMYGEEVTVPAGTFCTMQLRRVTTVDGELGSNKQYWFARGVGKVKERSNNRREELSEFTIP